MKKIANKGFTLVELIIVIAILAIIMLIAIPNFSGIQQRMQVRADKSTAAQIGKAVRVWFTDYSTDAGMIKASNSADDTGTYALEAQTVGTKTYSAVPSLGASDSSIVAINYDNLVNIDEYISRGQKPSSLKPSGVTEATQEYSVFFSAGLTDTAAKVVVAVAGTTDGTKTITISKDAAGKIIDNYDGTVAGVAYVEP